MRRGRGSIPCSLNEVSQSRPRRRTIQEISESDVAAYSWTIVMFRPSFSANSSAVTILNRTALIASDLIVIVVRRTATNKMTRLALVARCKLRDGMLLHVGHVIFERHDRCLQPPGRVLLLMSLIILAFLTRSQSTPDQELDISSTQPLKISLYLYPASVAYHMFPAVLTSRPFLLDSCHISPYLDVPPL